MVYVVNVKTTHKLFGTNEVTGKVKYLINDDNRLGIVVGKWEIYGNKKDENFFVKRTDEEFIIRDNLIEIHITASKKGA